MMPPRSRYDELKVHEGKRYTGMAVGRSHKWRYDAGEWKERKVTPDRWEFTYSVVKRRAGRAPEGSGAPVGTAYHWYIVADQIVTKLDANSYQTEMVGHKLKLSHRRADKSSWSASERARRKQLVKLLRELITELEHEPVDEAQAKANGKAPAKANGIRVERAASKPATTRRAHTPPARANAARAHTPARRATATASAGTRSGRSSPAQARRHP